MGQAISHGRSRDDATMRCRVTEKHGLEDDSVRCRSSPNLAYISQQENWDCGVACLLMVWTWLAASPDNDLPSNEAVDKQRNLLLNMISTKSIWTVDLVHALYQMHQQQEVNKKELSAFDFTFFSMMLAANEEWKDYAYYAAAFDQDEKRTRHRLETLRAAPGMAEKMRQQTEQRSIRWFIEQIDDPYTIAIILVDNSVFKFASDDASDVSSSQRYLGHYLVVTGIAGKVHLVHDKYTTVDRLPDIDNVLLVVYDPHAGVDCVSAKRLELAWQASGTDQDVIFIHKLKGSRGDF